jgi:5-methylcytosine-specific restriction endonuclease McrA
LAAEEMVKSQKGGRENTAMLKRECPCCHEKVPADSFRKKKRMCVWCEWGNPEKRAKARYSDIRKRAGHKLEIGRRAFVEWYKEQEDRCAYCGLSIAEVKSLRIKHGRGYFVSWDIDRLDPSRPYEPDNLALACFVCNMAKGDLLSPAEARTIGRAVRQVWKGRL